MYQLSSYIFCIKYISNFFFFCWAFSKRNEVKQRIITLIQPSSSIVGPIDLFKTDLPFSILYSYKPVCFDPWLIRRYIWKVLALCFACFPLTPLADSVANVMYVKKKYQEKKQKQEYVVKTIECNEKWDSLQKVVMGCNQVIQ